MVKEEPVSKRCNNTAAQKPFVRALTNGRYKIFCENNLNSIILFYKVLFNRMTI